MNKIRSTAFGFILILSCGCGFAQTYEPLANTASSAYESFHADLRKYDHIDPNSTNDIETMRNLGRYSEIAVRHIRFLTSLLRAADKAAASEKHKDLVGKRIEDSLLQLSQLDELLVKMQKLSDSLETLELVSYKRRIGELRRAFAVLQKEIAKTQPPRTQTSSK